ncbi:chorismate mutase [Fibrobacterota bacterium]
MEIEDYRNQIDEIDRQILGLLKNRALAVQAIAKVKKAHSLPVFDPDREERILDVLQANNPGPLKKEAVRRIFSSIIEEHRKLEEES